MSALRPYRAGRRAGELADRLELRGFPHRPVRQLSLGERMRGELAAALLHEPELLVLDEPTVGLDVLSKERLRVFLREELAATGGTLLLTTHDMDDVQRERHGTSPSADGPLTARAASWCCRGCWA